MMGNWGSAVLDPGYMSGRYYTAFPDSMGSAGSGTTDNLARFSPVIVRRSIQISELVSEVVVASSTPGTFRFAIFADRGDGRPGNLIYDSGPVGDATVVGNVVATPSSPITLTPGTYWFTCVPQGGTTNTQLRCVTGVSVGPLVGSTTGGPGVSMGSLFMSATGAFPSDLNAFALASSSVATLVYFKVM